MRVLHLRESDGDGVGLALHPQVTVVEGLAASRRAWLVEVLGRLAEGSARSAVGEVEVHGIRFDLSDDTLGLLDLAQPVRAVVRSADLPGHDPQRDDAAATRAAAEARREELLELLTAQRTALAGAVEERDAAREELEAIHRGEGAARRVASEAEAARSRAEVELRAATQARTQQADALAAAILARDAASEARVTAGERLERARARRREAMEAATAAAAALEQTRSVAADDPTDRLAAARDHLRSAEAAAAEADPDRDGSVLNRRLADLERRRTELVRLQEALGAGTAAPVAEALDHLLAASGEPQPVVAALALADTWRDLHQQIHALDAGVSAEEHAAEERVAMARRTVVEAEADYNQPVLTPEQIAKVEAAHHAVLEAQDRTEGRFGGGRSRKKLDEARSEERRVLERLGFSTYADYMMSSSSRGVGPANRAILETAKAQLAQAEQELASLPGAADRARRRTELLQRRDAVAPRVAELLGHEPTGPEAEDELRQLREEVAPDEQALAALAQRLAEVGIVVGDPPYERDDLTLLARSFLAEQQVAEDRRREVNEAIDALDRSLVVLREERQRGGSDLPELPVLPPLAEPVVADTDVDAAARAVTLREARWAELEAARAAVAALEGELAQHRSTGEELERLTAELAAATEAEESAAAAVAAAEAEVALANGPAFEEAVTAVTEAEASLARAEAREAEAKAGVAEAGAAAGLDALVLSATDRRDVAEATVTEAAAREQELAAELAAVEADRAAAVEAEEQAAAAAAGVDRAALLDELHWELLSRLAAVRSVGIAGSVPLVLDEAFAALDDDEVARLLDRVAQLAGAVQVVVLSDRPAVGAWAQAAGSDRAAVVAA